MIELSKQPGYAAFAANFTEINEAIQRTVARIAEIEPLLAKPQSKEDNARDAAAKIIADRHHVVQLGNTELQGEHQQLRAHHEILLNAQRLRQGDMARLESELSEIACRSVAGVHRHLAAKAAQKLRELDELQADERALMADIERHGYSTTSFRERVFWPYVGTLATLPEQSMLSMRINELERYAASGPVDVPAPPSQRNATHTPLGRAASAARS